MRGGSLRCSLIRSPAVGSRGAVEPHRVVCRVSATLTASLGMLQTETGSICLVRTRSYQAIGACSSP